MLGDRGAVATGYAANKSCISDHAKGACPEGAGPLVHKGTLYIREIGMGANAH